MEIARIVDVEFVLFDEIENFPRYNSRLFDYPYQMRKTKLGEYSFTMSAAYDYNYIS